MDLKLPITIHDEMEDEVIVAKGVLDLASGDITQVVYEDHDLEEGASTRLLVYAATLIHGGMPPLEACHAALVEPLTDDAETIAALREVIHASLG